MNRYYQIGVSYLRPSKTIESIMLKNSTLERVLYVYNNEGLSFHVFFTILEILDFFNDEFEPEIEFSEEEELEVYLQTVDLQTINSFTGVLREFRK
jgi:hypothetical protein